MLDYNPTGDGILTSIFAILIMLKTGKSMSELKKCIKIYPQVLVNAKVEHSKKDCYLEDTEISSAISELEEEFKESGRVLIRPSGTESLIRVMIEGENTEYILKKAHELASLMERKLG